MACAGDAGFREPGFLNLFRADVNRGPEGGGGELAGRLGGRSFAELVGERTRHIQLMRSRYAGSKKSGGLWVHLLAGGLNHRYQTVRRNFV